MVILITQNISATTQSLTPKIMKKKKLSHNNFFNSEVKQNHTAADTVVLTVWVACLLLGNFFLDCLCLYCALCRWACLTLLVCMCK